MPEPTQVRLPFSSRIHRAHAGYKGNWRVIFPTQEAFGGTLGRYSHSRYNRALRTHILTVRKGPANGLTRRSSLLILLRGDETTSSALELVIKAN